MRRPPPPPLQSQPAPGDNVPEYSVSQLAGAVKRAIEGGFGRVRVRGEISGLSRPNSGHVYLQLKDESALIEAVIWKTEARRLAIRPSDGLEVIATGRMTTHGARSKYQLIIEHLALAGQGALLQMLEARRRQLAEEGLFDQARKRPLPFLPEVIAIITSPTGSVIQDMLHRLRERMPVHILLFPVQVQGEAAAAQITRALAALGRLVSGPPGRIPRPQLAILARGGGSLEDLMAFNEEAVVRAIAALPIPLISGVGHETDTTLADCAADHRAPTPSAAAEQAVPVRADLLERIGILGLRLNRRLEEHLAQARLTLQAELRALPRIEDLLGTAEMRLDQIRPRLPRALALHLERSGSRLRAAGDRLRHPADSLRLASARLEPLDRALRQGGQRILPQRMERLASLDARLNRLTPSLQAPAERVAGLGARLEQAIAQALTRQEGVLAGKAALLQAMSPDAVLARGYALVLSESGSVVTRKAGFAQARRIRFADGEVPLLPPRARRAGGAEDPAELPSSTPAAPPQGRLF